MNNMIKWATPRQAYGHPFFRSSFPSFFDEAGFGKDFAQFVPAVNIAEDEKSWHIEVSAAGFKKEDFSIKLENEVLTISAEQKKEEVKEGTENKEAKNYRRREFRTASFTRSFRLPKEKVNEEGINASYDNGILNLSIPKKVEEKKESLKEIKVA